MSDADVTLPPFQVAIVVTDLEAAMDELGGALGLRWAMPQDRRIGPWSIRVTFSRQGPPFVELIEGQPGSPWGTEGGPRFHHIGVWTDDLEAARRRLDAEGLAVEVDGTEYGGLFTYHRARSSGVLVELIDRSRQAGLYRTYDLSDGDDGG